jgi:hypothetical protein
MAAAQNRPADDWHLVCNRLFLAYVRDRLGRNPRAWGDFPPYGESPLRYAQCGSTRIAVRYKNQCALDLTELPELPTGRYVREYFARCMAQAETDIAAALARP